MKKEKDFLKEKFIQFQLKIAELTHALKEQKDSFRVREKDLYLNLLEMMDAFESLDETIQSKENEFGKTGQRLAKNVRAIHRKLFRLLNANNIVRIEFSDNKARMDYCKIVDTKEAADLENETILSLLKSGYIDKQQDKVLRKAEVITVLNR